MKKKNDITNIERRPRQYMTVSPQPNNIWSSRSIMYISFSPSITHRVPPSSNPPKDSKNNSTMFLYSLASAIRGGEFAVTVTGCCDGVQHHHNVCVSMVINY